MIPLSTVKLLRAWARWGESHSIDFPSMSPMFGERALKTPLFGVDHIPPDVLEMEYAVCRLHFDDRMIIIHRWQRRMSYRQIALRIGKSHSQIGSMLRLAEAEVHRQLEMGACVSEQPKVNSWSNRNLSVKPA